MPSAARRDDPGRGSQWRRSSRQRRAMTPTLGEASRALRRGCAPRCGRKRSTSACSTPAIGNTTSLQPAALPGARPASLHAKPRPRQRARDYPEAQSANPEYRHSLQADRGANRQASTALDLKVGSHAGSRRGGARRRSRARTASRHTLSRLGTRAMRELPITAGSRPVSCFASNSSSLGAGRKC